MISPLNKLELFHACFSCCSNSHPSQGSSGLHLKNIVFEIPETEIVKLGDLGNLISVPSRLDLLPGAFTSKYISFAKSYIMFLSDNLARPTLPLFSYHFQKIPL